MAPITRRQRPRLYTIAPGMPFTATLVDGIIARHGADPAAWPSLTVLVPNRRAVRALSDAFLRASGGQAALLPAIRPIGDVDAEDLAFEDAALAGELDLTIAPAIAPLERQCLLARLVARFEQRRGGASLAPAQTARLAAALARLLDQIQTERLDMARLAALAPEQYSSHWQQTLKFLEVVTQHWPAELAARGQTDPAQRRNALLEAQHRAWSVHPPSAPVIAAGTTGSVPAVADLLALIARLPQGAVVLPGFDRGLDDADWEVLGDSHPQGGMKRLLAHIGASREEVADWHAAPLDNEAAARMRAVRIAFTPAANAHHWHRVAAGGAPLPDVRLIEAASPREEAGAIAFALREVLETPGKTAALVTPDRDLARRVAADLQRWGVTIDDSAGQPLAQSPAGRFLRLSAEAVINGFEPVSLLALLKHPLATLGLTRGDCRTMARRLEKALLRGVRPAPGAAGLAQAAQSRLKGDEKTALIGFIDRLRDQSAPLAALAATDQPLTLSEILQAHLVCAESLAGGPDALWAGDDGQACAQFATELAAAAPQAAALTAPQYPALFSALMEGRVIRSAVASHPRLAIWGTLEARLQSADRIILGGLNEGVWPREIAPDPWMSEPMRQAFGLPAAARRIGLGAHDFVQALAAPDILLSRASKAEGAPTVPSRWLARLKALYGGQIDSGQCYVDWARAIDAPPHYNPVQRPAPRPPVAARPKCLSVTQVETWRRDPYALYARHVLKLQPLDPLDQDPSAADRGNLAHDALDRFIKKYGDHLPDDAYDRLLEEGRAVYAPLLDRPAIWGFWWPRFCQAARWFLAQQQARAGAYRVLATEVSASLALPGTLAPFTLTAKADRIDRDSDGKLEVIDYKTGTLPSDRQIEAGYAPQMPLQGWLAEQGAFAGVPAATVATLSYWPVKGLQQDQKIKTVKDPATHIARAVQGLTQLADAFANPQMPYLSSLRPKSARPGDYDHLARVAEWRGEAEGEDG
ncbi:MAG: double-strand break repair protein AddB [Sphingomonadales bacterium]